MWEKHHPLPLQQRPCSPPPTAPPLLSPGASPGWGGQFVPLSVFTSWKSVCQKGSRTSTPFPSFVSLLLLSSDSWQKAVVEPVLLSRVERHGNHCCFALLRSFTTSTPGQASLSLPPSFHLTGTINNRGSGCPSREEVESLPGAPCPFPPGSLLCFLLTPSLYLGRPACIPVAEKSPPDAMRHLAGPPALPGLRAVSVTPPGAGHWCQITESLHSSSPHIYIQITPGLPCMSPSSPARGLPEQFLSQSEGALKGCLQGDEKDLHLN